MVNERQRVFVYYDEDTNLHEIAGNIDETLARIRVKLEALGDNKSLQLDIWREDMTPERRRWAEACNDSARALSPEERWISATGEELSPGTISPGGELLAARCPEALDGKPLVIISCGREKLATAAPAAEIYTGQYFRAALACARSMATDGDIRILSAKYGFVRLDRVIEPYDLRIDDPGAVTNLDLMDQVEREGLLGRPVVALCGQAYTASIFAAFLRPDLPGGGSTVETPLHGIGGIGKHLQYFNSKLSPGTS